MLLSLVVVALTSPGQALALCFNTGAFQTSTLCWNPINPIPAEFDIESVLWNPQGSEYLAVGGGGAILTSPDGIEWTPRDSGTVQGLFGGLWDGQRYLVVGDGGALLTSPDGINWTGQVTNTRARLLDVAVNGAGTRYVVVGENGTVLSSADAIAWSETTVLSVSRRPALYGVVWHDNRFIAVGSSTTIISSVNGVDWVEHNYTPLQPDQPPPPILRDVAVGSSGGLVAVGSSGTAYTSTNGTDWEPHTITGNPDARLRAVVWIVTGGDNHFLAVGDNGAAAEPLILRSQTGIQWSPAGALPGNIGLETLKTIAFNGSTVVTGGKRHLLTALAADLDWTVVATDPDLSSTLNGLRHAEFPNPLKIAVGDAGSVLSSNDGLAWTRENSGTDQTLNGLAIRENNGVANRVVAVGANGTILFSDDGKAWSPATISVPVSTNLADVSYGNGTFVAVGAGGTILTSTGGDNWDVGNSAGFQLDLHGVTFGMVDNSPLFVAVGDGGALLTSSNGINWVSRTSGVSGSLRAVIWNADSQDPLFVAVGQTADALPTAVAIYSADGTLWTLAEVPLQTPALRAVAWSGHQFLAISDRGAFLRSTSGRGWTAHGVPREGDFLPRLNALAWTGDRFLAAGESGWIVASGGVDLAVDVDDDLSESEDDDPSFALAGLDKTFRFTVSNIAILDATNVQFTYTLPQQVTNLALPVAPAGWNCALNGSAGASCNTGRLDAGTGDAVIIELTMTMPTESNITIIHNVDVPAEPINDNQPANNQLAVDTRIGPREAPGLPSPDTDFSSDGAFGSLDILGLLLLVLAAGLRQGAGPRPRVACSRP